MAEFLVFATWQNETRRFDLPGLSAALLIPGEFFAIPVEPLAEL